MAGRQVGGRIKLRRRLRAIPYLPEQAARLGTQPSMAVETIVKGLGVALAAAVSVEGDIKQTGGTIC